MYFRTMQVRRYLPNALTMGNLLSGVLVIIGLFIWPYGAQLNEFQGAQISEIGALSQRLHGQGMLALALIWIAGQLCDLLDGIAARWAKTEGPVLTTDRNTTVRAELRRRQALLLMYFMRDPLYGILTGRVASSALGTLSRIPLLGFFFEYFLEMLEYMKRYYFFWSGS